MAEKDDRLDNQPDEAEVPPSYDVGKGIVSQLASEEPEREVSVDLAKSDAKVSYKESGESPNETDLGRTLRRLFLKFPIEIVDHVAQAVMVAGLAPDVFKDFIYLTVTWIVEKLDAEGADFDVQEVIDLVYCACSIGLDRMGRIDIVKVVGAVNEADVERVSRSLGMAG